MFGYEIYQHIPLSTITCWVLKVCEWINWFFIKGCIYILKLANLKNKWKESAVNCFSSFCNINNSIKEKIWSFHLYVFKIFLTLLKCKVLNHAITLSQKKRWAWLNSNSSKLYCFTKGSLKKKRKQKLAFKFLLAVVNKKKKSLCTW